MNLQVTIRFENDFKVCVIHEDVREPGQLAVILTKLAELKVQGEQIMSAVSEFAGKVTAHNDKIDAAVQGLTSDVADLKAQIEALQNTAGEITAEDQALLDGIESRAQGIVDKLAALDALTPPVAPSV